MKLSLPQNAYVSDHAQRFGTLSWQGALRRLASFWNLQEKSIL
jgi:hypothetical protein